VVGEITTQAHEVTSQRPVWGRKLLVRGDGFVNITGRSSKTKKAKKNEGGGSRQPGTRQHNPEHLKIRQVAKGPRY